MVDNADVQWLVADLWEHDRIALTNLKTNQGVLSTRGSVKVPKMMISLLVPLVNDSVKDYAGRFGSILSVIPAGRSGQAVITNEHSESSHISAGVQVPG